MLDPKNSRTKVAMFFRRLSSYTRIALSRSLSLFRRIRDAELKQLLRQYPGIQLDAFEISQIRSAIHQFLPCRLLVFGLGNDSPLWQHINSNGRTVFLEDCEEWFEKMTSQYPDLEANLVHYPNNITQWRDLLDRPEELAVNLPDDIMHEKWDVILVDGPRGHWISKSFPGRMSSIFMASRLVGSGGYVFVHDAQREVESAYCERYLGQDSVAGHVWGRALLKKHHFGSTPSPSIQEESFPTSEMERA